MAHRASVVLCTVSTVLTAGCVPRDWVNASCVWRERAVAAGAPGTEARRTHLAADARAAQELGVQHADLAVGRPPRDMREWERAERRCTAAAIDAAVRTHVRDGVTRAELDALRGARDWWFDLLAIFLPVGLLFAAVGRRVAGGVAEGSDGNVRMAAALLTILTPIAAVDALVVTQMWGWMAEVLRLRNDHLSYRAFQLPTSRHPWLVLAAGAAVFAVVSVGALRRMRRTARDSAYGRTRASARISLGIGRRAKSPRGAQ